MVVADEELRPAMKASTDEDPSMKDKYSRKSRKSSTSLPTVTGKNIYGFNLSLHCAVARVLGYKAKPPYVCIQV